VAESNRGAWIIAGAILLAAAIIAFAIFLSVETPKEKCKATGGVWFEDGDNCIDLTP
jgi:hypothetical protein